MAKAAARTDYDMAMERLGDAIEALDEVQTLFAGEGTAPEFWVGIIFAAQNSLAGGRRDGRGSREDAGEGSEAAQVGRQEALNESARESARYFLTGGSGAAAGIGTIWTMVLKLAGWA